MLITELTPQEIRIIGFILDGLKREEAASRLRISVKTLNQYLWLIYDRVGINNIAELAHYAVRLGVYSYDVQPVSNERLKHLTSLTNSNRLSMTAGTSS